MNPTPYSDINEILDELVSEIENVLKDHMVAVYLYGSLVWGDFNQETSDIDLLVVIESALDPQEFDALERLHLDFVDDLPEWENRIEIAYVPAQALTTFKSHASAIGIISPGEPFHLKEAGNDWLINWYMVREKGVVLYGPPPEALIPPITKAEFIEAVKEQARQWESYIYTMRSRPQQAYGILTLCRALYAVTHGAQVSKLQAALWAQSALPQWRDLIQNALLWREAYRHETEPHEETFAETVRFVQFVIEKMTSF